MFTPYKPLIIFYEKRGCSGNARQKELLKKHGISFETRSLLDTPWTKESLSAFFENLTPQKMLNPFAPQVKEGRFDVNAYSKKALIEKMIEEVLAANPKSVEEFKAGKEKALNALVGQVMKASRGKANPAQVQELMKAKLA